jgi:hypothetical protein
MKLSGFILSAGLLLAGAVTGWAADATSPLKPAERNTPFAATPSVTPEKKEPEANAKVQEKRVDKNVVEKTPAAVGDRRAAISVEETRDKNVRDKNARSPERVEQPMSAYNHRESAMATGANTSKPQTVAKYQDGMTSASATNMSRFPAIDRSTAAKINRFIFRKNAPDTSRALEGATLTPAAGPAAVQKK